MLPAEEPGEQQAIAQRVDAPGNAAARDMDEIDRLGLESRVALPAHVRETMLDVGLRFGAIHRPQVVGRDDALPELLHLRALHHVAQLGLADQEALQQCLVAELEIRQHPQFLDRARRQVLRLVDHQQRALLVDGDLAQEGLERREQ